MMSQPQKKTGSIYGKTSGFTLIEVCMAMMVLGLTIASSLVALRMGFGMIESARDSTLASQILQSEMENLRLKNWEKLVELEDGTFEMEETFQETSAARFTCNRYITTPTAGMRLVILEVIWNSSFGVERSLRYVTYFSEEGLNDYYYRILPQ